VVWLLYFVASSVKRNGLGHHSEKPRKRRSLQAVDSFKNTA